MKEGPPYLKIGGRIVYRISDVEAFEAARSIPAMGRGHDSPA
jgi:hypothetical protein